MDGGGRAAGRRGVGERADGQQREVILVVEYRSKHCNDILVMLAGAKDNATIPRCELPGSKISHGESSIQAIKCVIRNQLRHSQSVDVFESAEWFRRLGFVYSKSKICWAHARFRRHSVTPPAEGVDSSSPFEAFQNAIEVVRKSMMQISTNKFLGSFLLGGGLRPSNHSNQGFARRVYVPLDTFKDPPKRHLQGQLRVSGYNLGSILGGVFVGVFVGVLGGSLGDPWGYPRGCPCGYP